ncbi:charged multivesicular body protein 4b-like isoform X2 [Etheostoma spectabile]|uniref:charged multivesicular body protein 4b isoform X2 n=1 Tax=Etheostoma spectabile TaxID=54343 RepID=UPI0013AEFF8E|nr:charged multivesicular body protein 4b-like isoform X2 [Etheostoma spectabile]XP_032378359.1 charged multivesicular body protein 4b-like isoform X2 [Etheostoma spectabile]
MSLFGKLCSGGEKAGTMSCPPCQQKETETLPEREDMLVKKKDFLKTKIYHELLVAKKNSIRNRRVALQALRRKKYHEKHIKYIDCALKAMREILNKMNDLIKDITEEHDPTLDMSDTLHTSGSLGVEFDENELLAELERLVSNLDPSVFEKYNTEDKLPFFRVSTASPSQPAKTDEDEIEDDLEYLRRWAN